MKRLGILAGAALTPLLLGPAPASAQQVVIDDPSGNASQGEIDFTRVTLDNGDHAVTARLRLYNARSGTLIVSVDPRGGRGVRMISEYDPVGHTTNYVVDGAFGESHPAHEPSQCKGFRVNWSMERPIVTLKLPSSCLDGGDYGAVRFAVLTEGDSGSDADDARGTRWVPRG